MKLSVLSSGSKGNSTLIDNGDTKILIDLGVTKSYVEEKLNELEEDPKNINAILITHTHVDHIQGLKVFLKKYHPIVYVTEELLSLLREYDLDAQYKLYENNKAIIGNITITLIKTSHDAKGSIGFVINDNNSSCVYITDTGYINSKYFSLLKNHNLYIMESNHDVKMLMNGGYPYHLKKRILGDKGHLSNDDAAYYLSEFIGYKTKTVILAHLSDENNNPDIALQTVKEVLDKKDKKLKTLIVAKQKQRTDWIEV